MSSISQSTGYSSYKKSVHEAAQQTSDGGFLGNTARILGKGLDQSTGYDGYRESVAKGAADSNGSMAGAFGSGLKGGYMDKVYTPQAAATQRDFDMAQKYGSSSPAYDAVMISMGRHIGTTPAAEAGTGWELAQDRSLSGEERLLKGSEATAKLAGNAALVAGMMPSLRHMPLRAPGAAQLEGRAAHTTLGAPMAADAEALSTIRQAGIPAQYAEGTAAAFGDQVNLNTVGRAGKTVYRYSGGDPALGGSSPVGRWVSDTPLASPRAGLGLPSANTARKVSEFSLKPGSRYLQGTAASQVNNPALNAAGNPMFGPHATGGANQMMLLGPGDALPGMLGRSGYTPTLTTGGAATAAAAGQLNKEQDE